MFRDQGCAALADLYSHTADELTQQIAVTGLGGLASWQRDAVNPTVRGHKIPTYGKGVGPAGKRIPEGRPDGQAVIAGHGVYVRGTGDMQMPSGTWGYFYVEDGARLRQSVGLSIEKGGTVNKDTLLSDILKPGMGPVHIAICREHCDPRR
ncbi:hypothetical protein SABIM44S_04702 [Streptomyces abikoensis]